MKPGARESQSASESVSDCLATTHTGEHMSFARPADARTGGAVLLSEAHTPGCKIEACQFRDRQGEFDALGGPVRRRGPRPSGRAGVVRGAARVELSAAVGPRQRDRPSVVGAKRTGRLWHRRRTVDIGTDGELLGRIDSESRPRKHSEKALALLRRATAPW
jgi:hypothetical protein